MLNESYLSENIKFIEYYASREKEILDKFCQELQLCNNYYNSTSQALLSQQISEIKINTERLFQKRKKYNEIFLQVIAKYNAISEEVKRKSVI